MTIIIGVLSFIGLIVVISAVVYVIWSYFLGYDEKSVDEELIRLVLEGRGRITCNKCKFTDIWCKDCMNLESRIIKKHGGRYWGCD
jgi:hypothetical protein